MTCPHCSSLILPQGSCCERCGFSLAALRTTLGDHWVRLDRVTDAGGCLRLEDRQRLERALDDFERQFPQCFFAVYLGAVPSTVNAREVGFWLLNHGAFNTHLISKCNEFGMVLVIDPFLGQVSFTVGYALESVFSTNWVFALLKTLAPLLRRNHHAKAINKALRWAATGARRAAQCSVWVPSASPEALEDITDMGFQPLKPEHRAAAERKPRKMLR